MPSITLTATPENFARIVSAIAASMNRVTDESGVPIETDEDLIKRYIRNKIRTEVLRREQSAATAGVNPVDDIIT